jgi:hypothetical protein
VGGPIRIMVGQNNSNHDYWSNQFLGGLTPPQGNLEGPGAKNFTAISGDQFFTLEIPEPTSAALVFVAGLGFAALGRKRLV